MTEADRPGRGYPKGERKRAEIVAAAAEAFGTLGYRTASMAQIASACRVSRSGLVHHFPTKELLLAAVLVEHERLDSELFFGDADPGADGLDYLARMVRLVEHNASTPGEVGLFAMLSAEATDPGHPAHEYFVDRYASLRRVFRQALDEVDRRGLVRPGVSVAGLETELIALIDGLQVQWLLDPGGVDMAARVRQRLEEVLSVPLP